MERLQAHEYQAPIIWRRAASVQMAADLSKNAKKKGAVGAVGRLLEHKLARARSFVAQQRRLEHRVVADTNVLSCQCQDVHGGRARRGLELGDLEPIGQEARLRLLVHECVASVRGGLSGLVVRGGLSRRGGRRILLAAAAALHAADAGARDSGGSAAMTPR